MDPVIIESDNVRYSKEYIESDYDYETTNVQRRNGSYVAKPVKTRYTFRTKRAVPKLGVMLVGWGGNNGTTVTAATIANKMKMSWRTKEGLHKANYFGSITQASTVCLGTGPEGEVYVPMSELLPMVHPNDIVFDGKREVDTCVVLILSLSRVLFCHRTGNMAHEDRSSVQGR